MGEPSRSELNTIVGVDDVDLVVLVDAAAGVSVYDATAVGRPGRVELGTALAGDLLDVRAVGVRGEDVVAARQGDPSLERGHVYRLADQDLYPRVDGRGRRRRTDRLRASGLGRLRRVAGA
jgi:hypothetical protein